MVKLDQQASDYIYSQLENYYNDDECNSIIEIFQNLYDSNKICSMSAVEVIELGKDFIKIDDREYYQISDIVNLVI